MNEQSLRDKTGLKKKKDAARENSEKIVRITIMGAIRKLTRKKQKYPDLLYSVTSHRSSTKINNLLQMSGAILTESRRIFLGKVLMLLRYFDPKKAEILYMGKNRARKSHPTWVSFPHPSFYRPQIRTAA